jgi:AAA+ superfamily predicted ATPase
MSVDQPSLVAEQLGLTSECVAHARQPSNACGSRAAVLSQRAREVEAMERAALDQRHELPVLLLRRLGLTETELRVVWTLVAHELSPEVRHELRELGTEVHPDVCVDVIRRVVYGSQPDPLAWQELSETGRLQRLSVIHASNDATMPVHRRTLTISPRILALVHGDLALDPEVAAFATIAVRAPNVGELEIADSFLDEVERAFKRAGPGIVVYGPAGTGKRSLLVGLAARNQQRVLEVDSRSLAADDDKLRAQLRAIARECKLFDCMPLFRDLDALTPGDGRDRIACLERELDDRVLATARAPIPRRWNRACMLLEIPALTARQRARVWQRAFDAISANDAEVLATLHPLAPAMIAAAGIAASNHAPGEAVTPDHVRCGIRSVLDDRLVGLATRVSTSQSWDDLVLPDDQIVAIVELLARVRQRSCVYESWGFAGKLGRGLGVTALFSGPPGTGKTMCAGLIARELGTELYQVDTSRIASKWIGETEKNLAALFDAAEAGHALLLFDEADALFGKRTDVHSSVDRHANQETSFLLQRIERFSGICILTTNHERAIDEAFKRRLALHVRFPVPEVDERKKLWAAMIPKQAPVAGDLELDELADAYAMTGGYIRNAVLRAAFLAADEGIPIEAGHLARAAQLEYEAMGKLAPNAM